MFDALVSALAQVTTPTALFMIGVGVIIGFIVGVLPGLGGAVTLALLLPFAFTMDPVPAFALLLGMYVVASTAGDITSVLFGVPGEASSAAVVLDGFPMARQGEAGRALGAVLTSSVVGALFGIVLLVAIIPVIRPIILNIGPPEFLALAILGLSFVVALSSGAMLKGGLMCLFGVVLSLVGLDPATGVPRYTFGQLDLWEGISIVAVVIGLFGGAEVLQLMMSKGSVASSDAKGSSVSGIGTGVRDALQRWPLAVRSGGIGAATGVLPGLGGSVGQFIAYGHAKQVSKRPQDFGRGSVEGVVSAGATGVAKDCGALVPTVAFGIPGSAGSAVLLGAFLILGLNPGEEMLTTNLDVTLSLVWITLIATIAAVALALVLARPLAKVTHMSGPLLVPGLLLLIAIGAYSEANVFTGVIIMLVFVAIGVVAVRWDWPRVPLLLGFVLGEILERYLFLSDSLYGTSWLQRPGFIGIITFTLLMLGVSAWRRRRSSQNSSSSQVVGR